MNSAIYIRLKTILFIFQFFATVIKLSPIYQVFCQTHGVPGGADGWLVVMWMWMVWLSLAQLSPSLLMKFSHKRRMFSLASGQGWLDFWFLILRNSACNFLIAEQVNLVNKDVILIYFIFMMMNVLGQYMKKVGR